MPTTVVGASSASIGTSGWFRAVRRIASSVSRSSRTSSSARLLLLAACELGQLRDQVGHLGELGDDVLEQLLRAPPAAGRRPACASTSMFVRRLVSGVRSSCEASWTSCRCRCCASSSDCEHRVEGGREAAELVAAAHLDPLREVARRAHVLGRLAEVAHRLSAARATRKPATDAIPMPPSATSSSQRRIFESSWSTFVSGVATTIAYPPGSALASSRTCWPLKWSSK